MMKDKEFITQKEASIILGKTLNAVHKLTSKNCWRTKIEYEKRVINLEDVLNYKPRKVGRPRKEKSDDLF